MLSKELIQEFKDILEKKTGKEVSWEEASEGAHNLANLMKVLFDFHLKDEARKKKLEEFPKGFHLDGVGYTCFICGGSASQEQSWYDKWGIKCMTCQRGIDRKEIPASLAKNKESWYSKYDLESRFNLKSPTIRSWVRKGILKARTITYDGQGTHIQLFLIKDNKDTLPPKKLTESRTVRETKDGKDWIWSEPWYKFVNPHEYLKGYKIMDHLTTIHGKEK
ncbi:MAG: hypothetical protein AAB691_01330 [Patescibacteria group bacterium]